MSTINIMIAIPISIIILMCIACSLEIEGCKSILKFLSIISILILLSVVIGSCKIVNSNCIFEFNAVKSFQTFLIIIFILFVIFTSLNATDNVSATSSLVLGIATIIIFLIMIFFEDKILIIFQFLKFQFLNR